MTTAHRPRLEEQGWGLVTSRIARPFLGILRDSIFPTSGAGTRCLQGQPPVAKTARILLRQLAETSLIAANSVAIQTIAFDKPAGTNWKVAWHQDLMFPFARRVTTPGFDLPSKKDGIDYARPPRDVLENLLAVRLHLDDCGESNGPLRITASNRERLLSGMVLRRELRGREFVVWKAERGYTPLGGRQTFAITSKPNPIVPDCSPLPLLSPPASTTPLVDIPLPPLPAQGIHSPLVSRLHRGAAYNKSSRTSAARGETKTGYVRSSYRDASGGNRHPITKCMTFRIRTTRSQGRRQTSSDSDCAIDFTAIRTNVNVCFVQA